MKIINIRWIIKFFFISLRKNYSIFKFCISRIYPKYTNRRKSKDNWNVRAKINENKEFRAIVYNKHHYAINGIQTQFKRNNIGRNVRIIDIKYRFLLLFLFFRFIFFLFFLILLITISFISYYFFHYLIRIFYYFFYYYDIITSFRRIDINIRPFFL